MKERILFYINWSSWVKWNMTGPWMGRQQQTLIRPRYSTIPGQTEHKGASPDRTRWRHTIPLAWEYWQPVRTTTSEGVTGEGMKNMQHSLYGAKATGKCWLLRRELTSLNKLVHSSSFRNSRSEENWYKTFLFPFLWAFLAWQLLGKLYQSIWIWVIQKKWTALTTAFLRQQGKNGFGGLAFLRFMWLTITFRNLSLIFIY